MKLWHFSPDLGLSNMHIMQNINWFLQLQYIECFLLASCFLYYLFEISQIPFLSEPIRCIKPLSCNFLIILAIVALDNFVTFISVWYVIALSFCIKSNTHASDLPNFYSLIYIWTSSWITMNTSHSNCCNKIFSFFSFWVLIFWKISFENIWWFSFLYVNLQNIMSYI